MLISSTWRTRIYGTVAAVLGVIAAVQIAHEQFFWPTVFIGTLLAVGIVYLQPLPLSTLLLGGAIVGYIVGNRGFAQLSLLGRFPLFPAEVVLLVSGGIMLVASALRRELPVRRDALNVLILLWMAFSSFRLYQDMKVFGVAALRDYATVYYAAFFFLAQWVARATESRAFLRRCLLVGCASLLVLLPLFTRFPDVFFTWLTFRGAPLIFFKGDLAGTFMAVGAVLFYLRFEERRSWWALVLSLALTGSVFATNNRASMLGLFVAMAILAVGGRWRFAALQAITGTLAVVAILLVAQVRNQPWEQTPVYEMYEKVVSIADPQGQRAYSGDDTFNKGDNNLFRTVWWRVCIDETLAHDAWLGLGWGYDLAAGFVRVYYPEAGDDFVTRSPHNVLVTLFARTGVVGLLPFLAVLVVVAWKTWRAARAQPVAIAGLWCGCWVILTAACLGVVLEGPMGAVIFWTLLGLANAETAALDTEPMSTSEAFETPATHLRGQPAPDQLASAP